LSFFTLRLGDQGLELLDQRRLPVEEVVLVLKSAEEVARAIEDMVVRGAPAIGVTAAMGVAVELRRAADAGAAAAELPGVLEKACARLRDTRPTAVNLAWALDAMERELAPKLGASVSANELADAAETKARLLMEQDVSICRAIGDAGSPLVPERARVLTHCNAGALATAGYGTALGVIRSAMRDGRIQDVLASETRPFLQGARLTCWELTQDDIPVTLITDSMAGSLMHRGEIDLVVVGADRIAANGDVANKIGTYSLAVLARAHELPFYVAAPCSTVDLATPDGASIPIEERSSDEVVELAGRRIAPEGVLALHPAFDVTPAALVTAIVTEKGVLRSPYGPALRSALKS
jgi:methylthioribose-1-phosphate isomerase